MGAGTSRARIWYYIRKTAVERLRTKMVQKGDFFYESKYYKEK